MAQDLIQRAFAAGELAPSLHARADLVRYVTGLRTCRNFWVRREGGVDNRPGLRYIATVKNPASDDVTLMRYESPTVGGSLLIEAGLDYLRFYKAGALVHEEAGPMGSTLIANWRGQQDGDTLTLTRTDQAPLELTRGADDTTWTLAAVTTAPSLAQVSNLMGTAGGTGDGLTYAYIVCVRDPLTGEIGPRSGILTLSNANEPTATAPHALTWDAVSGATEYVVFLDRDDNGIFGYVGAASTNAFNDTGFLPDYAIGPPIARTLFDGAGAFPNVAAYYQDRRFFAYTDTEPERIEGSQIGRTSNFDIRSPLQDDDAISFKLRGGHRHAVRWMLGLRQLLTGTDGGVWTVGRPKEPLSPSNIPADQETFAGVADKPPVAIGNTVIYIQARQKLLRDLRFDEGVLGYAGRDLTTYASHLFKVSTLVSLDVQLVPHSIVWVVRGDGVLLGLTYLPEEDMIAWHRHDSQGAVFEHVCVVPEAGEDAVYVIAKRTIDGSEVRYIERLETRDYDVAEWESGAFFVDSGITYDGSATATVTGLDHLEGETVVALADGVVREGLVVSGGQVTLPVAASVVHVGLPITAEIETLDLDVSGTDIRARKKLVRQLQLLVENTAEGFQVGPDATHLRTHKKRPAGAPAGLITGREEVTLTAGFNEAGRTRIRQTKPLPISVLGVLPHVDLGG